MTEVVIGGAASGKSEYAEKLCAEISNGNLLFYLATMIQSDSESAGRIKKHRLRRSGMGFITIEKSLDIGDIKLNEENGTVLVECVTNLVANEIFCRSDESRVAKSSEAVSEKIFKDFVNLYQNNSLANLVIVTGNVFEDGIDYDKETMYYIETLAKVNNRLAGWADNLTEVVCGISLKL